MEIKITHNDAKGSAFPDGKDGLAEMTFSLAGADMLIIDHTEVDDSLRGQGVGMKLLEKVISFADESGRKIIPLCPYARAMFERNPELRKILKQ